MYRYGIVAALALLALTGLVFALAPEIDLAAARMFLREGVFLGINPAGEALRTIGFQAPFWLLGLACAGWALRKFSPTPAPGPSTRAMLYLFLTLALGPGLLVNAVLKNHSHRPRPVQTLELGGKWEFRPWYRFDGACERNCSFVSGEASTAFWTLAPALLTPLPVRPLAVAAALVFGTSVAALRMAFGGHYLSDSLISALLTILIVLGSHWWFFGRFGKSRQAVTITDEDRDLRHTGAPL
ncbi:MAG: Membrane-associated enzyme (Acid phosphatase) superfamily [Hyphomicrobiales bacterium]|nr:Membrane-associated enzyme (Acid phosphatase) superfamily [Hyphomicrobiales bacterium]